MVTDTPNPKTRPVEDTVPKVNDEVAVGDDLEFQRRWAIAERIIWAVLVVFLVLSFLGAFGRGPARARQLRFHGERNERQI